MPVCHLIYSGGQYEEFYLVSDGDAGTVFFDLEAGFSHQLAMAKCRNPEQSAVHVSLAKAVHELSDIVMRKAP